MTLFFFNVRPFVLHELNIQKDNFHGKKCLFFLPKSFALHTWLSFEVYSLNYGISVGHQTTFGVIYNTWNSAIFCLFGISFIYEQILRGEFMVSCKRTVNSVVNKKFFIITRLTNFVVQSKFTFKSSMLFHGAYFSSKTCVRSWTRSRRLSQLRKYITCRAKFALESRSSKLNMRDSLIKYRHIVILYTLTQNLHNQESCEVRWFSKYVTSWIKKRHFLLANGRVSIFNNEIFHRSIWKLS